MRLSENIEVKQNLSLVMRERGKIIARRDGHNIWLDTGRAWLARLLGYSSYSPLTAYELERVRYMGFGIGGTRQVAPAIADAAPLVTHYPAYFTSGYTQTDTNPAVTKIERPILVDWTGGGSPALPAYTPTAGNKYLGQVNAITGGSFPTATQVTFVRLFTELEISKTPFLTVPLSEIALFTNAANPELHDNIAVAYDTFDSVSKTSAFSLEVQWTIRF
jgi:hypothetical protein